MNIDFASLDPDELAEGYAYREKEGCYGCLFCGEAFEEGYMYPAGERFADARRTVKAHIRQKHDSAFAMLLSLHKRHNGLTDTQKDLLSGFYKGLSDGELSKALGLSLPTVRVQRFHFREKVKQAKVILALSALLEKERRQEEEEELPLVHNGATMVDERYMTRDGEADMILRRFFSSLEPLKLKTFSTKEKNKLVILRHIAGEFETSKRYTEKQINEVLQSIYDDYATLRRYLIEYGFMKRTTDCRTYWLCPPALSGEALQNQEQCETGDAQQCDRSDAGRGDVGGEPYVSARPVDQKQ